jgi:predicted esterase
MRPLLVRPLLVGLAVCLFGSSARAEPARVTVVTKDGRRSGTLAVSEVEVKSGAKATTVPLADVATIQFGDVDLIRTRQGARLKGTVNVDGWALQETTGERPLARADLRFLVHQAALGPLKRGKLMDGATAEGMTFHVRVPDKYDPAKGGPAIVLLHGSNANSADYVTGVGQAWPKVAADYVLIGIDGEWPVAVKNLDGPPAFNYTYVNFVGKSKYKGFPGTDRESPALVAEAVAEIRLQLKLTKVFVTGHSQGGFLAYSCLMNSPDVFDGAMPIAGGLIFQCEPTAYQDADARRRQRVRPLVILHGGRDPLVAVSMAEAAYESFLDDGFPMLRLLVAKQAAHAFISLPFEDGIRWLESMSADDPKALVAYADRAFVRQDYRDALNLLQRAQAIAPTGPQATAASSLRQKIDALAAAPTNSLEAAIRRASAGDDRAGGGGRAGGDGWVADFDALRQRFEFTDAKGVMAEYAKLRAAHEPEAEKQWADARKAFQAGDKVEGYRVCQEIVGQYPGSSYYRYAKRALVDRK